MERFKRRIVNYPERDLAGRIYRTRDNLRYCKGHGIHLSGPRLGRQTAVVSVTTRKQEYQDNTDWIGVERAFSLRKRCYGMGLIMIKLEETQLTTIALSAFVTNLFKVQRRLHFALLQMCQFFRKICYIKFSCGLAELNQQTLNKSVGRYAEELRDIMKTFSFPDEENKDLSIVNEKTAIIQEEIKKRISIISKEISGLLVV